MTAPRASLSRRLPQNRWFVLLFFDFGAHRQNDIVELENELESLDEDGGRMATDEIM